MIKENTIESIEVAAYNLYAPGWSEPIKLIKTEYKDSQVWVIEKRGSFLSRGWKIWSVRLNKDCTFKTPEGALTFFRKWIEDVPSIEAYRDKVMNLDEDEGEDA